jgi:aryl-alcohol dehydrogenase-like predicted oxidoreductase
MRRRMQTSTTGMTRRELFRIVAAGAALLAAGGARGAGSRTPLKRPIPRSGEMLPAVGLGTSLTFDVGTSPAERAPLREVLQKFVELGGSVVDTAPMYGRAESVVGDLVHELGVRDRLFLATKVWTEGRQAGIHQMETSMQRLRTTRLDLMQVHNLVDVDTQLQTLRAWKRQGRIRYLGITHYTAGAYAALERLMKSEELDFVQFNYSMDEREAEQRLLPLAQERGIAVIVNRPFERAGLFGKVRGISLPDWAAEFDCSSWAQFFLKYILAHPAVTCVIPATSKVKHLEDNMQAGLGRLPDAKMREKMVAYLNTL